MNERRRVRAPFVSLYQTECMLTIPKCTTSVKYFCAVAEFSKGLIQMLISAARDDTEWNCKTTRMPTFRDGPPFLAI